MPAGFKLVGARKVAEALNEMGAQVASRLGENAVRAGSRVIIRAARKTTAFRDITGVTRASIKVMREMDRRTGERTAYFGSKYHVARLLETGTARMTAKAWLRPAMDNEAHAALQKMVDNLGAGINRTAVKYGGKADSLGVYVEEADLSTDE